MSEIIEILGEKKFAGSTNTSLSSRVILDESNKIRYENNLFYDISQQQQFATEKQTSYNFRMYGKINPILSLDAYESTYNNDRKINLNLRIFDFNLTNWSIVVLKSKPIPTVRDANDVQLYSKGTKIIQKSNTDLTSFTENVADFTFNADFRSGIPARTFTSLKNQENYGLFFPLGHNFNNGDKIKIESKKRNTIESGMYEVVFTEGDRIFINLKAKSARYVNQISEIKTNTASALSLDIVGNNLANNVLSVNEANTQNIKGLTFNTISNANLNKPRPKIQPFVDPDFYVTKIVEKEALEYYVKNLEVIAIIDELDDCAFSTNNLQQQIKNYFLNNSLNIENYINNKGEPLTDLYIGIIKNGSPNTTSFSDVESHFNFFIDFVGDNDGLEKITNSTKGFNKKVNIGDSFYYALCENSTENLTETEISEIHHRFIHNNVLFNYKPFYKINLKLKSLYIEDSGDNTINVPNYAIFSRSKQKYIWRDIYDVGSANEDGLFIDFPFMNGSFYVFNQINFFLVPEKRCVRRYQLSTNDITSLGSQFTNEFGDILGGLDLNENNNEDDPNAVKPYNQYKDVKC